MSNIRSLSTDYLLYFQIGDSIVARDSDILSISFSSDDMSQLTQLLQLTLLTHFILRGAGLRLRA